VTILQYFEYAHLPEHLQTVSAPFGELAVLITTTLPANEQRAVALQKLLEAKDAAVRAKLDKSGPVERLRPEQMRELAEQIQQYMRDGGRLDLK
jgi:hypothetical protein